MCQLSYVLSLRLVCRTFNQIVNHGIVCANQKVGRLCDSLRNQPVLYHAYNARDWFRLAGICAFRAMDERWHVRDRDALSGGEEVRMWMRLMFNKPRGAEPPRDPNSMRPMVCVHGQCMATASAQSTRQQARKRVRFRLCVPEMLVPQLTLQGWVSK